MPAPGHMLEHLPAVPSNGADCVGLAASLITRWNNSTTAGEADRLRRDPAYAAACADRLLDIAAGLQSFADELRAQQAVPPAPTPPEPPAE